MDGYTVAGRDADGREADEGPTGAVIRPEPPEASGGELTPAGDVADYTAIEAAVMETARGRWFLAEYARRNRQADTTAVLAAIDRLGATVGHSAVQQDRMQADLQDMTAAVARTRAEIAALRPSTPVPPAREPAPDRGLARSAVLRSQPPQDLVLQGAVPAADDGQDADSLDAVALAAEAAAARVLNAAERLQEIAWHLREAGVEMAACHAIDRCALDLATAAASQDLAAQRTRKAIGVLRYLESRLEALSLPQPAPEQVAAPGRATLGAPAAMPDVLPSAVPAAGATTLDSARFEVEPLEAITPEVVEPAFPAHEVMTPGPLALGGLTADVLVSDILVPDAASPAILVPGTMLRGSAPTWSAPSPGVARPDADTAVPQDGWTAEGGRVPAEAWRGPLQPEPPMVGASTFDTAGAAPSDNFRPEAFRPEPFGAGLVRTEVTATAARSPSSRPMPAMAPGAAPRRAVTLADIEALPFEEKAALFS